ncbi:MAG TPA: hypothetical protein VMZ28_30190, partial [Kofleriaceae bacterium]|nr:hypothetical protein [Kofleriaceae bacterium]
MARRSIDEEEADRAVMAALDARGGVATRADLVVATALPETVVERAVDRLLEQHESSVGVAKGGVLLYRFARGFPRRRERRTGVRRALAAAARAAAASARTARVVFRFVLAVQLIIYLIALLAPVSVVIGVVVGIVVLLLAIFSDAGGDIIAALADPYAAAIVLGIAAIGGIIWVFKRKAELLLRLVGVRQLDAGAGGLQGLIANVSGFAVGPPRPARRQERLDRTWTISQADERRVLARIRARGGRLRAGDLVAWLGFSLDQADSQATRLSVEYGGDPTPLPDRDGDGAVDADAGADEIAVLEFRFPSLMDTAGGTAIVEAGLQREETRFERAEPPPRFTGNLRRVDLFIALFALANLAGGLVGHWLLGDERDDGFWWWLAWLGGAAMPIGFSALLFLLPLLRAPVHLVARVRAMVARARGLMVTAMVTHARAHG